MIVTPKVSCSYKNSYPCTASPPGSGNFVDLSQESGELALLPGAPLDWLRKRHELYWSYDPRGRDASIETLDSSRYCKHCRCPNHYCAEVMFGAIVTNHVVYLIVELGDEASVFDFYIKATFKHTSAKLIWTTHLEVNPNPFCRSHFLLSSSTMCRRKSRSFLTINLQSRQKRLTPTL